MRIGGAEVAVEIGDELHAGLKFVLGEAGLELDVFETVLGIVDVERAVGGGKKAGAGVAAVVANEDELGQGVVAAALEDVEPGAHGGVADGAAQLVAGVHHVVALLVRALGGGEGVDDGGVVHLLGGQRQELGHADAVGAGLDWLGRAGGFNALLRIPGVEMGLAAAHVEVDDVARGGDLLEL